MKLKSAINEINASAKEIVLQKRTFFALTTEKYLEISEQPQNTCPFIDDAIKDLGKSFFRNSVSSLKEIIQELGNELKSNRPKEDSETTCNCYEEFKDNYREIDHFLYTLIDIHENKLKLFERQFEELRGSCQQLRDYGETLKDLLWKDIDNLNELKIQYNELLKSKPELKITAKQFYFNFTQLSKNISYPNFSNLQCKEWCDNCTKDGNLQTFYMTNCKNYEPELSSDLDRAFENYQKLEEWVMDIEEIINQKINNSVKYNLKFAPTEKDIHYYQEQFNKYHQKSHVEGKFYKNLSDVKPFTITTEMEEFSKVNENLAINKKIEKFAKITNEIIKEYLANNDRHHYESACEIYARLYTQITGLHEQIMNEFDLYKSENTNFYIRVLKPIRSSLSSMASNIRENGPQVFEIQKE